MFSLSQGRKSGARWALLPLIVLVTLLVYSITQAQVGPAYLELVRVIDTSELGVAHPAGLAFSPEANVFLLRPAYTWDRSLFSHNDVVMLTPYEDAAGQFEVDAFILDPLNIAFDAGGDRLWVFDPLRNDLLAVAAQDISAGGPARQSTTRFDLRRLRVRAPRGMTLDPASGDLFILDATARVLRIPSAVLQDPRADSDAVLQIDLSALQTHQPRGIAFNANNQHLYVLSPSERQIFELDLNGQMLAYLDLNPLNLSDPHGLVFAPSGDPTDDPARLNLYIADSGLSLSGESGGVVELSISAPAPQPLAAVTVSSSLVRTTNTSSWSPPSPDPSGVAYWPQTGRLLISDGEVDEMPRYFTGVNVFDSSRSGNLQHAFRTTAFSNEPTDVAVNPINGNIFYCDDDKDEIFEIHVGADGQYGTSDDTRTHFDTRAFNSFDPEGIAFDSRQGHLWIADGQGAEAYQIRPGPNGVFDGVSPAGDDQVSHFDLAARALTDPEGVAYNFDSGTLFFLSKNKKVLETTTSGAELRVASVSYTGILAPAGITYGPGSNDSSTRHLYLVDRRVDNGVDPNENDGRMYEVTFGSSVATSTPPGATATASATPTAAPPGVNNTGWISPRAQAAQTGGDGNGYQTSPTSAFADDSAVANDVNSGASTSTNCTNTGKDRHAFFDYPITLPAGATISGIEVRLDARADSASGAPHMCVAISWNNGASWTAVKQNPNLLTTERSDVLGGATNTWGRTWNTSELSSTTFRVRITDVSSSTSRDFFLDWVPVRITYTGGAAVTPTASATLTPTPTHTAPVSSATFTPTASATPTATNTPSGPSATFTPTDIPTDTPIAPTPTDTPTPSNTPPGPSATFTPPAPTSTFTPTASATPTPIPPTNTPTPTNTATAGAPGPTTVTLQVSASTNDVNQDGSALASTAPTLWLGNASSTTSSYTGIRFTNLNLPPGAIINSARLEVFSSQSQWIAISMSIAAEAAGNSPAFATNSLPSQRILTTQTVNHSSNVQWLANTWFLLNEIRAVIQEVINRPDWQSGNSLSIILRGTGTAWGRKFITSWDGSPASAPRLIITYTAP